MRDHDPDRDDDPTLPPAAGEAEVFFARFASVVGAAADSLADTDPLIGQTINHYLIEGRLGEGGMGVVYRALDTRLKRTVALKFLPEHLNSDARAKQRFLIEARAAAALDHNNICTIHEVADADGQRSFIAMAFYAGQTLEELLAHGPMPWPRARDYAMQIARGLGAAHERGIVHRDVKPGNVMVTADGTVKLLDFGIARMVDVTSVSVPGLTPGTLAYMSPEQATNRPLDARTDLWSLGVMLYEMCTGTRPFRGQTQTALLYDIVHGQPEPPSKSAHDLPRALDGIMTRLLEKDPARRYASAHEVVRDLTRAEDSPPPERVVERWPARRQITFVSIAALVVVAALVFAVSRLARAGLDVDANRVAVLPFEQRAGPDSLRWFGTILADQVAIGLERTRLVQVVPASVVVSAAADVEPAGNPTALAELTRAGLVVSGSYFIRSDTIHMQAAILDVTRNESLAPLPLVSVPVGEEMRRGIDAVLQQITVALSTLVDPRLAQVKTLSDLPRNMETYREWVAASERQNANDYEGAWQRAVRAAELDSTWVPALLGAALKSYGFSLPTADSLLRKVELRKHRLSSFDLANYEWLRAWLDGDLNAQLDAARMMDSVSAGYWGGPAVSAASRLNLLTEAERRVSAILDKPTTDRVDIEGWRAWEFFTDILHVRGDHRRELKEVRRGIDEAGPHIVLLAREVRALAALGSTVELRQRLDDLHARDGSREIFLHAARELRWHGYPTAADTIARLAAGWYEQAVADSSNRAARILLAEALFEIGDTKGARAMFEQLAEEKRAEPPQRDRDFAHDVLPLGYLGIEAAQRGDTAVAEAYVGRLANLPPAYLFGRNHYWQARIAAQRAQCDRAVAFLETALQQGMAYGRSVFEVPQFERLKSCRRFQQFTAPKD